MKTVWLRLNFTDAGCSHCPIGMKRMTSISSNTTSLQSSAELKIQSKLTVKKRNRDGTEEKKMIKKRRKDKDFTWQTTYFSLNRVEKLSRSWKQLYRKVNIQVFFLIMYFCFLKRGM